MGTGTEIAVAQTGSLTLAETDHSRILAVSSERDLTEEQFAIVERIAALPVPTSPLATDDDVRSVIGALAGTLKMPRTSLEEGKLKLGMYRKALVGRITQAALSRAADRANRELQWMPTPAEIITLAKGSITMEEMIHAKAQRLARDRQARLMDQTLRAIAQRKLTEEEINALPERWLAIAETQGGIMQRLDGTHCYRTPEAIQEDMEARLEARERDTHAHDGEKL